MTLAYTTHWDLINASPDAARALSCDRVRVLGYSETEFPDYEQRFMVHPRLRPAFRNAQAEGRLSWHNGTEWPEYDLVLAWRGAPQPAHAHTVVHSYVCQNLNHRSHRYRLVRELAARGTHRRGLISYGNESIPWENCGCGRLHWAEDGGNVEEEWKGKDPVLQQFAAHFDGDPRYSDPQWAARGTVELPAPPVHIWETAAFNLVTETEIRTATPTEKTWQAVLYGRPFLALTGSDFHSWFASQGYQLSPNVIDYSWDRFEHPGKPNWPEFLRTIDQLTQWDPQELYSALEPAAQHNQQRMIQALAHTVLPKAVRQIPKATVTTHNAQLFYEHVCRVIQAANDYANSNYH